MNTEHWILTMVVYFGIVLLFREVLGLPLRGAIIFPVLFALVPFYAMGSAARWLLEYLTELGPSRRSV
jgi:hypothetical protein